MILEKEIVYLYILSLAERAFNSNHAENVYALSACTGL